MATSATTTTAPRHSPTTCLNGIGQYSTDGAGSFLLLLSQIGRNSWLGADSAGPSAGSSRAAKSPRGRVPGPRGPSWGRVDEGIAPNASEAAPRRPPP